MDLGYGLDGTNLHHPGSIAWVVTHSQWPVMVLKESMTPRCTKSTAGHAKTPGSQVLGPLRSSGSGVSGPLKWVILGPPGDPYLGPSGDPPRPGRRVLAVLPMCALRALWPTTHHIRELAELRSPPDPSERGPEWVSKWTHLGPSRGPLLGDPRRLSAP